MEIKKLLIFFLLFAVVVSGQSWTPAGSQNMGYTGGDLEVTGDLDVKGSLRAYPSELELMHRAAAAFSWVEPDDSPLASGTLTVGPVHGKGNSAFMISLLLSNGKVLLLPESAGVIGEYDPDKGSYRDLISVEKSYSQAVQIGQYVVAVGGDIALYNLSENSIEYIQNKGDILEPAALKRVSDNELVFISCHTTTAYRGIYRIDIAKKTYTKVVGWSTSRLSFSDMVLLLSGEFCLIPRDSPNIFIYNPVLNTFRMGAPHGAGENAFTTGLLMPSGKIFLVGTGNSGIVAIYDPVADVFESDYYRLSDRNTSSAFLRSDGKISMLPIGYGQIEIFDPNTKSSALDVSLGTGPALVFYGASCLTQTGKIVIPPFHQPWIGVYTPANSKQIPIFPLLSPFIQ